MMLTLSQSGQPDFGPRPSYKLSDSPPHPSGARFDSILSKGPPNSYSMSTSHRGLPPPSAMGLPDPNRPPPQPAAHPAPHLQSLPSQSSLSQIPAPMPQWQGGEDSMRHWLSTRAEEERTKQEEEKRRQEEERSRQESLKLEQRLIEQSILRESMQGGIPAHMIPVIFAGIGGPNLVSASVEFLQQYAAQLQASQQHVHAQAKAALETAPEHSDARMATAQPPPNPFAIAHQPPPIPQQQQPPPHQIHQAPPPPSLVQQQSSFQAYPPPAPAPAPAPGRAGPSGPTSAPRAAPGPGLTRLNTIDIAQPAGPAVPHGGVHGVQLEQPPSSSPSIYFHHWVPPATAQETKPPQASTPQPRQQDVASVSSDVEMKDSPRKRKAVGGHGPIPPPPLQSSPTFSSNSSGRARGESVRGESYGHFRSRSNKSNEEMQDTNRRPPSRRDSVATQLRIHEHSFQHDPHSRPQSHAGDRSSQYMR